jgi:hypothetical protein
MSTKTTFKRVALVTVAALGFGMVSVAPSQATTPATSTVSAASTTLTTTAGTAVSTVINLISAAAADTGTLVITPTSVSRPAGATMAVDANDTLATGEFGLNLTGAATPYSAVDAVSGGVITLTDPATAGVQLTATTTATALGTFSVLPTTPGRYVFRVSVASTAASTVDITVIALPAQASGTTSLTASVSPSVSVAATDTVITVARNAGGVEADGAILGIVTSTSDATDLPVGTVLGRVSSSTTDLEDNVATAVASTVNRTFTFDNDLSTKALAVASTTLSGTYGFTFWVDANSNGLFDSGEVSTTASYTIVAALSADTGISVSIDNATRANSDNVREFAVTATIADGAAATITESGTANLTNIVAGSSLARVGTSTQYRGTFAVDASPAAGSDFVDVTLTVTSGSFSNTATLRVVTLGNLSTVAGIPAAAITDAVGIGTVTDGVKQTLTGTTDVNITATVDRATALTHTYTFNAATGEEGEYLRVAVAPAGTTASTVVAPAFALVAIGADLQARYSVVATAPAAANSYTMTVTGGDAADVLSTITFATATPAWTVSPSANIRAKFGDTSTVTGSLADQFGRIIADKPVNVVVTGRQAGTYTGTTNAAGQFAFTWKDVNPATTVTLTDVLTFNYPYLASATATTTTNAASSSRTVTYSATGIAVGSVSVAAPSATNTRPIDMDAQIGAPAAGSVVTYIASVRDAAGLPVVAGALVTFTGGADDLFVSGSTGVTDEFGQASVSVYRTKVGAPTITATAGGVTSAAAPAVRWTNDVANNTPSSAPNASSAFRQARYIALAADIASAVSTGVIRFTATVTDRFGNAVAGSQVTFSETGAGRFFNPPTSNQVTTNAAGQASIDLNSQAGETGAVSVTATITDATALQLLDTAGFMTNVVADATPNYTGVVTAVAGVTAAVRSATATATITKDTSTSTADALLALAQALGTRDQASAALDSAAEATDAANAATDAANAAAEAADAATAAAQDAADAVAALSTQVSEMVNALKKQITSLTNLVIKIQRKVRA